MEDSQKEGGRIMLFGLAVVVVGILVVSTITDSLCGGVVAIIGIVLALLGLFQLVGITQRRETMSNQPDEVSQPPAAGH